MTPDPSLPRPSWLVLLLVLLLGACGTTASDLPLPGSRVSGDSYVLEAEFEDALNLADGAPVKRAGVTVGRVREIRVEDFRAHVSMDVLDEHRVKEGTHARLRSTTPLGELFVDLEEPEGDAALLAAGATLGTDATSAAPTVEDTMSAASMLINGGGLGQVQTVVEEVNAAIGGREDVARDALRRIASTTRTLNDGDDDLGEALEALAAAAEVLDEREDVVDAALRDVRPAARVLRTETDELVELLTSVDALGTTAVDVIDASRADLLSVLEQTGPVLAALNTTADDFGPGLETLVGFARLIDEAVPAEHLNTYLYFQTSLSIGLPNLPLLPGGDGPRLRTPGPDEAEERLRDLVEGLVPQPAVPAPGATEGPTPDGLGLDALLGGGR